MSGRRNIGKIVEKLLPPSVVRHYIKPLLVRQEKVPYNAKEFFETYHERNIPREFSDRMTINPAYDLAFSRYHYNTIENSIIEYWARRRFAGNPSVLDIGSGSGHWIDFYRDLFDAREVFGIEISTPCVQALTEKYKDKPDVTIVAADISAPDFVPERKFDVINAIGVIFHIVEDQAWYQAIHNLGNSLNEGGVMIIGGQFGWITQNVRFRITKVAASDCDNGKEVAQVFKRIRSMRYWKSLARREGLKVEGVIRAPSKNRIPLPENNLLILSKR